MPPAKSNKLSHAQIALAARYDPAIQASILCKGNLMLKSFTFAATLVAAPAILAQDAPPPQGGMPSPEQIIGFLDADKDGFIAKDEAQGPMVQYFDMIDADKDGKISLEELKTAMAAMRPPEPTEGDK
jgi:hypothetical protein